MPVYYSREERLAINRSRGILVDPQDQWLLEEYTWHIDNKGYARTTLVADDYGPQVMARLHNAILGCPIYQDDVIDHINRNPVDDRRCNLRWATGSASMLNRDFPMGASGTRGVYLMGKKYQVQIRRDGRLNLIGGFDTIEEAMAARDKWLSDNP